MTATMTATKRFRSSSLGGKRRHRLPLYSVLLLTVVRKKPMNSSKIAKRSNRFCNSPSVENFGYSLTETADALN